MSQYESPIIHRRKRTIEFHIHHECARQISLAGSFNHWAHDLLPLKPGKAGSWKIEIPLPPKGKYYYKFFVDERQWIEDVDNPFREPDGLQGWNSVLIIES